MNSNEANQQNVVVFDTTLRDGEQAPGCSMRKHTKLKVAHALDALGVDIMEAGFPAASPDDFAAVKLIANELSRPVICGLARATEADIEQAANALAPADRRRIHIFLGSSPLHRQFKLKMSRNEVLARAVKAVEFAVATGAQVEFSPEDALRTEHDFLFELLDAVAAAGATTLNVADTVGYSTPVEIRHLFGQLHQRFAGRGIVLSTHCHNDLGLAVANSLAAVEAGARQVECTINGIGERAGNASLEEVVMALRTRADHFAVQTNVNTEQIIATSRLVQSAIGVPVQRNKAIVGRNAFAHEAGIHQHGMMTNPETYEIMKPEHVGLDRSEMVLGKHSGRHAVRQRLDMLGRGLPEDAFEDLFVRFKTLADQGLEVTDDDLLELLGDGVATQQWQLDNVQLGYTAAQAIASVVLSDGTEKRLQAAFGSDAIEALVRAITTAFCLNPEGLEVRSQRVERDSENHAEAWVEFSLNNVCYKAFARGRDSVMAAGSAALRAVNRVVTEGLPNMRRPDQFQTSLSVGE